jgi:hypothetical protein
MPAPFAVKLRSDSAFAKFYGENEDVRRACGIAKQASFVSALPALPTR